MSQSRTEPPDITDADDNDTLLANIRERAYISYTGEPSAIYGDSTTETETQGDYHDRFIYELLQNADDAIEGRDDAAVRFELDGSTLYVANTGRPLTAKDVHSLCIQGLSSKSDDEAAIGRKGRGFTSVLELTDRPRVYSTEYQFVFDSSQAKDALQKNTRVGTDLSDTDVPTLRLPFVPETKPARVTELLAEESPFTTVFAFDLFAEIQPAIGEKLHAVDPQTLVFLQHLRRLEISVDGDETTWTLDRMKPAAMVGMEGQQVILSKHESATTTPPITRQAYVQFARTGIEITQRAGIPEGSWEGIETTQVGVAFCVETDQHGEPVRLRPVQDDPSIHVFLPTEQASPGRFLINGAFKPESSRTRLKLFDRDEGYNALLFDHVAKLLTSDVIKFAQEIETSVTDVLECLHINAVRLNDDCEEYCAERIRHEIADVPFIPTPDTDDTFEVDTTRAAISDLRIPSTELLPADLIKRFVEVAGPKSLPESVSDSPAYLPSGEVVSDATIEALLSLGADELLPADIPAILAAADPERVRLQPYEAVTGRAAVDPIVEVLVSVDAAIGGEPQEAFRDTLPTYDLFPIRVTESGRILRSMTEDVTLLLPPEEIELTKQFHGLKLFAPEVYRPEGWEQPAGKQAESDGFKEALRGMWDIDEFDLASLVQGAIFPYLPRGWGDAVLEAELQNSETLSILRELAMSGSKSVVDPTSPLPHEFRKKSDYYRLCLLTLPTKEGDWVRAHRVYMGPEWVDDEGASAVPLLRDCDIGPADAPELVSPEWFLELEASAPGGTDENGEDETGDDSEEIANWRAFLRWLGATPELKLTPLWHPEHEREYRSTSGIDQPSAKHPTLGAGGPATEIWDRFASELETAIDDIEAEESVNYSIYRANRLDFWTELKPKLESHRELGSRLFTHLAYWWEEVYGSATTVGVGRHSTSASNVGGRSGGVPYRHERLSLGTNMWLCELQASEWCPADSGQYSPQRVWQRRPEVMDRFSLDDESETVVLPLLPEALWGATSDVSADFFEALGIHAVVSTETFEPADAIAGVNRISSWCRKHPEQVRGAQRELRTGYRNIARAVPDVDAGGDKWGRMKEALASTEVLCEVGDELELCPAGEAYFALDRPEADAIPLEVPTFVLKEPDASRFASVCGMKRLKSAVSKTVMPGETVNNEDTIREFLRDREDAIRCVLAGDRPGQQESDAEDVDRFIDQLAVVDSLDVEYALPGYSRVTESVGWAVERHESSARRRTPYVTSSMSGEPPIQRVAKALADYLPYPGVSELILILQAAPAEFEERLRLLDAPFDLLEEDITGAEQSVVSFNSDGSSTWEPTSTIASAVGNGRNAEPRSSTTQQDPDEGRTTTDTDPQSELIDPAEVTFAFESRFDLEPEPTAGTTIASESSTQSRSSGGRRSSNPQAAGKRNATDRVGSAILKRYELNRLARDNPSYSQDVIESCIVSVEKPDDVANARETGSIEAVLEWLTETVELDRQYPGFDYLVLEPSFVAGWDGEPVDDTSAINRMIELKSLRGDGQVSLSLNEWLTATTDVIADQYYLYVIGNLSIDRGEEFIREIQNPSAVLETQWEEHQQTDVSIKVNSKRFSSSGAVTQTPLEREE
ncbi:sacsin N-terminal ATP-binding-like domain-containing protein [Halomarina litorea]|uniref:sacsin N-terminal ATP-binding-like domain-containing protein n=1 Tax=Halomarina litorea TaxID=2961595 RepID=UPI0020C2DD37|nr:hypothetical protein [Halomarina sp. BCD28]